MAKAVNPIREGLTTITAHLTVSDARKAVDFYKKAFGAELLGDFAIMDGKVIHSEIKIGNAIIFLMDEQPQMGALGPAARGGSSIALLISTPDVDKDFERAVNAGCTVQMPLADQFWGDRYGSVVDPFGHVWELATHKEDISPEEMKQRMDDAAKQTASSR